MNTRRLAAGSGGNEGRKGYWRVIGGVVAALLLVIAMFAALYGTPSKGDATITLLQIGDVHGHLIPRPNLRSDGTGGEEGGLARMFSLIKSLRASNEHTLLFNTGDTIQGSAEALYTRGGALVNVLDSFGIDGFVPGNWDFLYGKARFLELFGTGRWGTVAANVYDATTRERVVPPYWIREVGGVKIGVMGLTAERGLPAIPTANAGLIFTDGEAELQEMIQTLRNKEKVDVLILLSELGLAKNVLIAEKYRGMDVILSSDMHEETPKPVITRTGTVVSEVGQDGTQLAELRLTLRNKRVVDHRYVWHTIDARLPEDAGIAKKVWQERRPFVAGPGFRPHTNPFNGSKLTRPIDTVVGVATVGLYRGNFSHEPVPGAVEGTSSNFLADAFRDQAKADVGHIRGFRYGTHVRPGPIKLEDIYHYIPIGPQIASTQITGQQLKNNIEASVESTFSSDPYQWGGGWVNGYGGLRFDLDLYKPNGERASNIVVKRRDGGWRPLDPNASYAFAGYWYAQEPEVVGGIPASGPVKVVTGPAKQTLDATEIVAAYLAKNPANPETPRINLFAPLPPPVYGNPEIQPLRGVPTGQ